MRTACLLLATAALLACNGAGDDGESTGQSPGRQMRAPGEATSGAGGASSAGVADPTTIPSTGPVPDGCVRIEGADIGRAGLVVELLDRTVTFAGWTEKDGEGEVVGFTITSSGPVAYAVKSGGETDYGTSATWVNPNGTRGPAAAGISNITLCPSAPPGGADGSSGSTSSGSTSSGGGTDACPGEEICPDDGTSSSSSSSGGTSSGEPVIR